MLNNPINHSFCFWPCPIDKIENPFAFFKQCKAMGYTGIEMVTPQFRPIVREAGLYIVNTNGPGMENGLNDLSNHDSLIPQLQENIRLTAKDEIKSNIIFTGNRKNISRADGIRNSVKGIKALIPVAEENGVTLLLELLGGETKIPRGIINPSFGTSGAGFGGSSLNFVPSAAVNSSFRGLNESLPPKASAIIISGLPIKFRVFL